MASRNQPAAPHQAQRHGHRVGELHRGEPDRPQPQRVALGVVCPGQVALDARGPAAGEPERLDGPRAIDGLGEGAVVLRVGLALAQVARGRPAEVPPRADRDQRRAGQQRQRHQRAGDERRDDGQRDRDRGDQHLGHREAHGPGQSLDVAGAAGDQVAGAGPLDGRQRQRQDAGQEVLAQVGEDRLGDHEAGPAGEPGQHGLGDQGEREQHGQPVEVPAGRAVAQRLDHLAEQARAGQPGEGGEPR